MLPVPSKRSQAGTNKCKPQRDRRSEGHPNRVTPPDSDNVVCILLDVASDDGDEDNIDEEYDGREESCEEP